MSIRRNAAVGAVIGALVLAGASAPPAVAASSVTFSATYGTDAGQQLDDARLLNGSQGGYAVTKNLHLLPETLGQVNSTACGRFASTTSSTTISTGSSRATRRER